MISSIFFHIQQSLSLVKLILKRFSELSGHVSWLAEVDEVATVLKSKGNASSKAQAGPRIPSVCRSDRSRGRHSSFQDFPRFSDESLNEIENSLKNRSIPRHSLEVCRASPCTRKQTSTCRYLQERRGYPQWTYGRHGMQKSNSPCVGLRLDYILEDVCDPILRKWSALPTLSRVSSGSRSVMAPPEWFLWAGLR